MAQSPTTVSEAVPSPVVATTKLPSWRTESIISRSLPENGQAKLTMAVHFPPAASLKHIVLYPSPNADPSIKAVTASVALELIGPWVRTTALLNENGIGVAYLDAPSDAGHRQPENRAPSEVRLDLQASINWLAKNFPGIPIHLGLFAGGAGPSLDVLSKLDGISKVIVASGGFLNERTRDWSSLKQPVMLIHAPSAQCDGSPFIEAQWVTQHNHFTLVQAGYQKMEAKADCGRGSQHVLARLDREFADVVAKWLSGETVPPVIGYDSPQIAWREQVVTYFAPTLFGQERLEMTLLFPEGVGPFPIMIFNHGDVEIDSPLIRYKQRIRDMIVAREFLRLGIAVAIPSRRGVGLSEGVYPTHFSASDGDPAYKARVHVQDIQPALEYLKKRPEVDSQRIILTGQSAGGYSTMYLASTNQPGIIGAVDFSGGRTDKSTTDAAGYLNRMMVHGFEEFGKTTRIPTLWVFAENDTRYTANTIKASYEAYTKAGGRAKLLLTPPIPGDGHFVFHKPELWRSALAEYLKEIGLDSPAK